MPLAIALDPPSHYEVTFTCPALLLTWWEEGQRDGRYESAHILDLTTHERLSVDEVPDECACSPELDLCTAHRQMRMLYG